MVAQPGYQTARLGHNSAWFQVAQRIHGEGILKLDEIIGSPAGLLTS